MEILEEPSTNLNKEEYNSIPVYFCRKCLSLKILSLSQEVGYCDDCGSTEIDTTDISTWKDMKDKKELL